MTGPTGLFRQEVLEHALRAEEGRGLARVSPPWTWALLAAVLSGLGTALLASLFGRVEVNGRDQVERFFRDITENRIRRGIFRSVAGLESPIQTYIAKHNTAPKPFIWTASAKDILAKVARARKALDATHCAKATK